MRRRTRSPAPARPLSDLLARLTPEGLRGSVPEVRVSGLSIDSRETEPGDLFVAQRGGAVDGHAFVADAVSRGAVAAMVEEDAPGAGDLPLVRVRDGREALAEVAAAWHGHPAAGLRVVGITGTMGKTSVVSFLEWILGRAGIPEGSIGSLGVRSGGRALGGTGHTVPGPIRLHEGLRDLRDGGCGVVSMEATTHAMTQGRLHGVRFDLGVFTGLVPLEHMEYHASFRSYAEAKLRYFEFLRPGAPLVVHADDPVLRGVLLGREVEPIPCGTDAGAAVRLEVGRVTAEGTAIRLHAPAGVRRMEGGESPPFDIRTRIPLVGHSSAVNAMLAAAAAASIGADAAAIGSALASLPSAPRRMQVVQREPFLLLDDYGGHPNTVSAVFQVVRSLDPRRLHVIAAPRGMRGEQINRAVGGALGVWLRATGVETLCLTPGTDAADDRNRALPEEIAAFREGLQRDAPAFEVVEEVEAAVERVMPRVRRGDMLLLLGAQCLDGASARARDWWARNHAAPARRPAVV